MASSAPPRWHVVVECETSCRRIRLTAELDGQEVSGAPLEVFTCADALDTLAVWFRRQPRARFEVHVFTDGMEQVREVSSQHLALYFVASALEARTAALVRDAYTAESWLGRARSAPQRQD